VAPAPSTWRLAAAALAAVAALAFLGLTGFAFSDYETEAAPAFAALAAGDLVAFLERCPAYGGALVLRAPVALATDWLGGGELAIYRAVALPCLLAAAALGVWLARRAPRYGWLALAGCAANPVTLRALEIGHPEELLGGTLCVAAVLVAARGRGAWAGVLLGLAVATKAWGVLAAGPVLLALPAGTRLRALAAAGLAGGAVLLPLWLTGPAGGHAVATGSVIFQPWQVWWWLGDTGSVVLGGDGLPKPDGWRTPPAWLSPLAHPGIAALVVPASLGWALARRPRGDDLLLLLAILLLARCVLDPWNTVYYGLPCLLALTAWEVLRRPDRPPVLALGATVATWATFEWLPGMAGPDGQSVFYLAWALPLMAVLVFGAPRAWRLGVRVPALLSSSSTREAT